MVDIQKAEQAIRDLLIAIGEDPDRPGLVETPKRCAHMYQELLAGMEDTATNHLSKQFDVPHSEFLLEKDITFYSLCEHHLLPFYGKVHIAYLPNQRVVGLSKLARTVEVFARRLQLQEQMTNQIADAIMQDLDALGAMVVIEAEHMCMTMRGVKKPGTQTLTISVRGAFAERPELQQTVLAMIRQ
ncbi:MAG: GTP cyclohydrolase I FolE [Peptococcaceae bacterium]|nr:GTP cyclohydrolase I FolE [Peptococcaceae bacterium]